MEKAKVTIRPWLEANEKQTDQKEIKTWRTQRNVRKIKVNGKKGAATQKETHRDS